ncbi:PEP-CTERM sorting domain-containing protein [Sphingomonas sp. So64.6b]|uniref:DUF4886 domain-containing protein n=1 Tax=Sphingomonas sp. So64.6b TaxID=2997354 RepID=UPI0016034874|nr:DUF4886 domain-containing protein [Sphingomonas sp. So64.6b]QNA82800.1 PEP-CTERM sorting domain-containing protein [Sphingomonas sp. So64.6b]
MMIKLLLRTGLALAALGASIAPAAAQEKARTILFVGNSFTYGGHSAVHYYRSDAVTDLNNERVGGIPALFKTFTEQAGLNYAVSLETIGGQGLDRHYQTKRALLNRAWDVVILQGHSTLNRDAPGDPRSHVANAGLLAAMFTAANPAVDVELIATWARADLVYRKKSPWLDKPITVMTANLRAASDLAKRSSRDIDGVIPVGEAWTRAMSEGVADANPYDGKPFGQVDLWTYDQYHGSTYGYYLEALMVFGKITGVDPRTLGDKERAADELGISPSEAVALQRVASEQLRKG